MLKTAIELMFAGAWAFIWHWGVGIAIIILCVLGIIFTDSIPVIGPWLGKERKWLEAVAIGTALLLIGEFIGALDATHRYEKKTVIIENTVEKVVKSVDTPEAQHQDDRFDNSDN